MALGRKTGGRKPGSVNKRTRDVMEKLDALNCDPISAMARLAMKAEKEGDLPLASRLYIELSPYTAPKRKAVEVNHKDDWERFSRDELQEQYDEQLRKELQSLSPAEKRKYMETEH